MTIRIAIIGFGKIARDQHLPSISANERFQLAAIVSGSGDPELDVPWFATAGELFTSMKGKVDAVAVCTPPLPRYAIARDALKAGFDVLLEKPPAATLGEIEHLEAIATSEGRTLYATWHSQHAAAVEPARAALADASVTRLHIDWREDVRKWHPGQDWIWAAGGFGVFDPGINALSIASRILPFPLFVRGARLLVPSDKQAPIAADIIFGDDLTATFDWRHGDTETWSIRVETADGRTVLLENGGAKLLIDGTDQQLGHRDEYPPIYARFAELFATRTCEVDKAPLRITADAFLVGEREAVEAFA